MSSTLRFCLLLVTLAVSSYYVVLHARVLGIDHPITPDEPGFVEITAAPNPYTATGVATCGNVYGPVYAAWARPFAAAISNPYIAHRVASTVALFLALGILGWTLRREGIGLVETGAGLAIFYILNVSSHSLAASADLTGTALFLAALAASRRNSWPSLVAGLAFSVLATLAKPYFALAWLIIASHLLLTAPRRRSLGFLALSAACALLLAGGLLAAAPYYFHSTFIVQTAASQRSSSIFLLQTGEFILLAGGLLLLAFLPPRRAGKIVGWSLPPLPRAIDRWTWSALVAALALLTLLAWHPGNYLVYFYHLLLGPLVIVALRRLTDWPKAGTFLVGANLLVLGYLLPPQPRGDNWNALVADVTAVRGPVLGDPLLEPIARDHPNVKLLTHGQTASILQSLDNRGAGAPPRYAALHRELLRRAEQTAAEIRSGNYSAIYLSYQLVGAAPVWTYEGRHVLDAVRSRYRIVSEVVIYPYATPYWDRLQHGRYGYHLARWEPRP
ncbi:MAG: hypothetical protein JWM88_1751 [Verrucomicrobia bacterium]|nr:hypothetical protein [Verrucomicrobiota bacterium]